MRKTKFLLASSLLLCGSLVAEAQKEKTPKPQNNVAAIEREIREFYDSYAEDLRQHRREAIADRYDRRERIYDCFVHKTGGWQCTQTGASGPLATKDESEYLPKTR